MTMTFKHEQVSSDAALDSWRDARPKLDGARWKSALAWQRPLLLRFFMGFSIVVATFAVAWPFLPRRYESTATIILQPTDPESASDSAQYMRQPLDENAIQSEIDRLSSPSLAGVVISDLGLAEDPELTGGWWRWLDQRSVADAELRQSLLKRLAVTKGRRSYTVKFGFRSSDPVKAAAWTKALLEAYVADQLARKRKTIDDLTGFLTERVGQLRARSEASQAALKDFLDQSGLIDTGATISLARRLSALSTEAAMARSKTAEAQARAEALTNLQKAGKLDNAPEILASPIIQKLKEKMAGAKSAISPVDIPQKAFNDQIATEADRIVQSVKTEAATSMAREAALERSIETIRQEMVRRQYAELHAANLRRDAESDRKTLDGALTRLAGQTARASAVLPHVNVISRPEVPIRPAFPDVLLTIVAAVLAGCFAGAAMIWGPLTHAVGRLTTR